MQPSLEGDGGGGGGGFGGAQLAGAGSGTVRMPGGTSRKWQVGRVNRDGGREGAYGLAFCLLVVTPNPHLTKLTDSPFGPACTCTYKCPTIYCASEVSFVFFYFGFLFVCFKVDTI